MFHYNALMKQKFIEKSFRNDIYITMYISIYFLLKTCAQKFYIDENINAKLNFKLSFLLVRKAYYTQLNFIYLNFTS